MMKGSSLFSSVSGIPLINLNPNTSLKYTNIPIYWPFHAKHCTGMPSGVTYQVRANKMTLILTVMANLFGKTSCLFVSVFPFIGIAVPTSLNPVPTKTKIQCTPYVNNNKNNATNLEVTKSGTSCQTFSSNKHTHYRIRHPRRKRVMGLWPGDRSSLEGGFQTLKGRRQA